MFCNKPNGLYIIIKISNNKKPLDVGGWVMLDVGGWVGSWVSHVGCVWGGSCWMWVGGFFIIGIFYIYKPEILLS